MPARYKEILKFHGTVSACHITILETTSADQWNHVATSDNPADAGTRGMSSEALACSNWLRGPDFLRTIDFPFIPDTSVLDNLQRKKVPHPHRN